MTHVTLAYLCAACALLGLIAYTLLGGADFGGGVWDLFASGTRKQKQRDAVAHAIGPIWEANHVWLIFVIVVLFTCFPRAFSLLSLGLFLPLHLTLLGIMLRGAAFIFRKYGVGEKGWGLVFGIASLISPFLLGASFGAVTAGRLRLNPAGNLLNTGLVAPWLTPYALGCGALAVSACSYLASLYLVVETRGPVRESFRRRCIFSGTTTAVLAGVVVILAMREASWFARQLFAWPALPVVACGLVLFAASAVAVFRRLYLISVLCGMLEICSLLVGWGVAHRQFLIYPDVPLVEGAAPAATLRFVVWSLPIGMAILLPSLWFLFHTFKREQVVKRG